MKKNEVQIGAVYAVKVSGTVQKIRLTADSPYGGWVGRNITTGREVRIKTAAKLRYRFSQYDSSNQDSANGSV